MKTQKLISKKQKGRASKITPPSSIVGESEDLYTDQAVTTSPRCQSQTVVAVVEDEFKHHDLKAAAIGLSPQSSPTVDKISRVPTSPSEVVFNETTADNEAHRLLAFLLGGEEYGISILTVREIIRLTEITPVPRAPSWIKGIISIRGMILPILNLHQLLSMPETQPDKKSRLLVVNLETGISGIIVDAVTEVVDLKETEIEPPPTVTSGLETNHIKGMGRYKGRLIILLDLDKVYTTKRGHIIGRAGQEVQTPP